MKCEQFIDKLNQRLDQRVDPSTDSELAAHAAECDDCCEEFVLYKICFAPETLSANLDDEDHRHRLVELALGNDVSANLSEPRGKDEPVGTSRPVRDESSFAGVNPWTYSGLAVAASILLLLLSPLGDGLFQPRQEAADIARVADSANPEKVTEQIGFTSSTVEGLLAWRPPNFAKKLEFDPMINFDHLQKVLRATQESKLSELEQVGQSISSVWVTIKEDQILIPIIKQSALLWVRGT